MIKFWAIFVQKSLKSTKKLAEVILHTQFYSVFPFFEKLKIHPPQNYTPLNFDPLVI